MQAEFKFIINLKIFNDTMEMNASPVTGSNVCGSVGIYYASGTTPKCLCQEGYYGDACQSQCTDFCSSHKQCTSIGTCNCDPGYTGATCALTCPVSSL